MRTFLAVAVALTARAAWPCSGLYCGSAVHPVPEDGAVIPANVPAVGVRRIVFSDASSDGGTLAWRPTQETVTVSSGTTTMTGPLLSSNVGLFVSVPALPVGSTWSVDLPADFSPVGDGCAAHSSFIVGPPSPLPLVSAGVDLLETQYLPYSSGSCGAFPAQQVARLRITATPEMIPWLPVARWELEVDGNEVATTGFGTIGAEPFAPALWGPPWRPFNTFGVECDGNSPWTASYLQPGLHSVRVLARIEGVAMPIASNILPVQVDCTPPDSGTSPPDSGTSHPDAGSTQPDASVADAGSPYDAGPADAGLGATDAGFVAADAGSLAPAPRGGCAAVPGAALIELLLPVLLVLSRRPMRGGGR